MQREMASEFMDKLEHRSVGGRLVFCSSNRAHVSWVAQVLNEWQILPKEIDRIYEMASYMSDVVPRAILLDFSGEGGGDIQNDAATMRQLVQLLKESLPHVPLIAVGSMLHPEGAVAALRAGVNHFIDMAADAEEARHIVHKLVDAASSSPSIRQGQLIALMGARPGIGTTTCAVHLADMLQQYKHTGTTPRRVGLLDLGVPIGDGQLYLNAAGNFNFADTVRSRNRMDKTLVQTALASTAKGLRVVPLPRSLSDLNEFTNADITALLIELRHYFDVLIIDLGGFPDQRFAQNIADASDQTWFVTDQSAGSLISLATMLNALEPRGEPSRRRLLVNRYDKLFGMSASQISDRFELPLVGILPERTLKVTSALNQGKLLNEMHPGDAYVRAIEELAGKALEIHEKPQSKSVFARLAAAFKKK
jgi:pilus assembly protein CpaE